MQKGISYQGFLPVRTEPSEKADMFSQLLFSESFSILEEKGAWLLIKPDFNDIEGWVVKNSVRAGIMPEKPGNEAKEGEMMVIHPSVTVLDTLNARPLLLPAGSVLKLSQEESFKKLTDDGWRIPGNDADPEECGKMLLSIPHLHGGRSGFGFDAAGLVQMLCRLMGRFLPHSIAGQAEAGNIVNFIHEAEKGDLAFFHEGEDEFSHVGMVLDEGKIIHVSDQVRIDKLDQQGIYCVEKESYTHQLRVVKQLIS